MSNSKVFTPDKPLRTGTVRGPMVITARFTSFADVVDSFQKTG
jgi:hypothetical protein